MSTKLDPIQNSDAAAASHLALICGDFNVNALPESEGVQEMILQAHPENDAYLIASAQEYEYLVKTLEGSIQGSLVD